jgi:putative ABC transport system permease protein
MIADIFLMSLDALRSHKVRTFLTLMGIIIGISSVIIVTSAGNSVSYFIQEQMNIFDPTAILVGVGAEGNPPRVVFTESVFTDNDVKNIQELPHVKKIAPVGVIPLRKVSIREGFLKWKSAPGGTMFASTSDMLDILNLQIEDGRIFQEGKNEIVITKSALELFGKENPLKIGDVIYIQRIDSKTLKAKIVGIIKESSEGNLLSQLTTPSILGPTNPYYSTFIGSNVGTILNRITAYIVLYATATDKADVDNAKTEILNYLNSSKSDAGKYKKENYDFVTITQQYIAERVDSVMGVIKMLVTTIALISLIVGAIGIANIMFATVTERTREIGTMMAIGAKRRFILQMFLYQSTIIGLIGAILGCILGASGSAFVVQVLNNYLKELGTTAFTGTINLIFSIEWFGIAVFFGVLAGILAGVLPARKAAKMDPVVALRYS